MDIEHNASPETYPATFIDPFAFSNNEERRRYVFRRFARSQEHGLLDLGEVSPDLNSGFWISPDGKYAIALRAISFGELPSGWRNYQHLPSQQFYLVNLQDGNQRPILDAPVQWGVGSRSLAPLWFPDSQRFILVNTLLPLDINVPERAHVGYLISASVDTSDWVVIARLEREDTQQTVAAWTAAGEAFEVITRPSSVASSDEPISHVRYSLRNGRWTSEPAIAAASEVRPDHHISVEVQEDMNSPPQLVAVASGRVLATRRARTSPSNQLALTRAISWSDADGSLWRGGLTLPRGRARGLVIQVGDFDPHQFQPDGSASAAFATQGLASQGFAVLRISIYARQTFPTGRDLVRSIDAAVAMLESTYGLPSEPVGLVGFSYTGWLATYVLSHPGRVYIGAAVDADGGDTSYVNYALFQIMSPGLASVREDFELRNGGEFWSNRAAWLEESVGFNLHRVETPLLITSGGHRSGLLQFAELYAGLRMMNKPVELVLFPDGRHQLRLPRQRLASMELTVDWMRFWLLGEIEDDPMKTEQYRRWSSMRSLLHRLDPDG